MKMSENNPKVPQAESPIAKVGGGDISEWELSRERYTLQTTPTARVQPAHPKRQLFSVPLNKFSAKTSGPSANLERIRSCLDEFSRARAPARAPRIHPKAISMEDLTPTKRIKRQEGRVMAAARSAGLRSVAEEEAAARVARFMLVQAWRRRRQDVRCLRKTLETQVSCSERLRIQVVTLKSLLDSDNAKVRLAMKELERLKQLVRDKDVEKHVLEREKIALEQDLCATEDKVAELTAATRGLRGEADAARGQLARCEAALTAERLAAADARLQRDRALARTSALSEEVQRRAAAAAAAGADAARLRAQLDDRQRLVDDTLERLRSEQQAKSHAAGECAALSLQLAAARADGATQAAAAAELRAHAARLDAELTRVRTLLELWPRPLTRMMCMARAWLRRPLTLHDVIVYALLPARHGCN